MMQDKMEKSAGASAPAPPVCVRYIALHNVTLEPYMLGHRTVKLKKELWDRVKRCSDRAGYSGPEELIEHVLERELAKLEDTQSDEEIVKKLKGLGYLE
ncbi:MAG TPA: hypothetical protein VMQ86_15915 [Bryobacteraceae bacterium]|nr:hypothetical protein [Bryobacteraceae bacterium]